MSQFFESVEKIKYEGPNSENPLAFRHYNEDEIILGKSMKEHLRFAACYWHNFCWDGADVFGAGTLPQAPFFLVVKKQVFGVGT